jgi:hypothetical protein
MKQSVAFWLVVPALLLAFLWLRLGPNLPREVAPRTISKESSEAPRYTADEWQTLVQAYSQPTAEVLCRAKASVELDDSCPWFVKWLAEYVRRTVSWNEREAYYLVSRLFECPGPCRLSDVAGAMIRTLPSERIAASASFFL